ncbi:hypothetical protein AB3S75_024559 [Citrus x aurantiifolia]
MELVRCTAPEVCTDYGVSVVVTDYGEGDETDFILSPRAYGRMAITDKSEKLYSYGVVIRESPLPVQRLQRHVQGP